MRCHGLLGDNQGLSNATAGGFLTCWQLLQFLTVFSISLSMLGHHKQLCPNSFILTIPGWLECNSCYMSSSYRAGITTRRPYKRQSCSSTDNSNRRLNRVGGADLPPALANREWHILTPSRVLRLLLCVAYFLCVMGKDWISRCSTLYAESLSLGVDAKGSLDSAQPLPFSLTERTWCCSWKLNNYPTL